MEEQAVYETKRKGNITQIANELEGHLANLRRLKLDYLKTWGKARDLFHEEKAINMEEFKSLFYNLIENPVNHIDEIIKDTITGCGQIKTLELRRNI